MKGKVVCKAEWIRFTERQKLPMFEDWDETVKQKLPALTYKEFTAENLSFLAVKFLKKKTYFQNPMLAD